MTTFPAEPVILFAHAAYQLADEFARRGIAARAIEVRDLDSFRAHIGETDVVVVSGMWRNELLEIAPRLRFIQSVSAGVDQYDKAKLAAAHVRLASAQGANERAVAEHAMAMILSLARQMHVARDKQAARTWRPMIGDRARREDELQGKTLVVVGFGRIGQRLAKLANAFDMKVIGVKRHAGAAASDVAVTSDLRGALRDADYLALTCPLTPETTGLIAAAELALLKPSAHLINVSRGRVVDEAALLAALQGGKLAGAAIDVFAEEPLPPSSPFWAEPNIIVTPHSAGETRAYETNVVDLLVENLARLQRGETELKNGVV